MRALAATTRLACRRRAIRHSAHFQQLFRSLVQGGLVPPVLGKADAHLLQLRELRIVLRNALRTEILAVRVRCRPFCARLPMFACSAIGAAHVAHGSFGGVVPRRSQRPLCALPAESDVLSA